jgi:hypothetical protein
MELKELIEKYTKDGVVDFEKAEEAFQTHTNGIIKKNVSKETAKYKETYTTDFIKDLGIEASDLDGVKKWVSTMNDNSTDFQKQSSTLQGKLDEALKTNANLQTDFTSYKQDTLIGGLGVDKEKAEFLKYKFNKSVNEDTTFESLVEEYKKENRITTNREVQTNFEDHNTSSPLEALKKLREEK